LPTASPEIDDSSMPAAVLLPDRAAPHARRRPVTGTLDAYLDFRADLRAALRTKSPAALRGVFWRWTDRHDAQRRRLIALSDRALEPVIREMILAEPQLADLHAAARAWLARHESRPAEAAPRTIIPMRPRRGLAGGLTGPTPPRPSA
jgi:hypothetical protein